MKRLPTSQRESAMTLVELLVVLVIIFGLAALIFPAIGGKRRSKHVMALKDMADLRGAIQIFQSDYGYLPISARTAALTNADFTFGTFNTRTNNEILNVATTEANNSEVIRILAGIPASPGTSPELDPRSRNPRGTAYFFAKPSGDTHSPGIGSDGVFRDPWGSPYILTFDLDRDGKSTDPLYGPITGNRNHGGSHVQILPEQGTNNGRTLPAAPVVMWSFGPDGKASTRERPDAGVNLDNITGWR